VLGFLWNFFSQIIVIHKYANTLTLAILNTAPHSAGPLNFHLIIFPASPLPIAVGSNFGKSSSFPASFVQSAEKTNLIMRRRSLPSPRLPISQFGGSTARLSIPAHSSSFLPQLITALFCPWRISCILWDFLQRLFFWPL